MRLIRSEKVTYTITLSSDEFESLLQVIDPNRTYILSDENKAFQKRTYDRLLLEIRGG